jgi:predicted transcriptional regulator
LDILMLKKKGLSQRQIANKLGISRNTVKKYLDNPDISENSHRKQSRKSLLDEYIVRRGTTVNIQITQVSN